MKILKNICAIVGALIGAAFVVLPILAFYDVFDAVAYADGHGGAVYLMIALAACFILLEIAAIALPASRRAKAEKRLPVEARPDAPAAVETPAEDRFAREITAAPAQESVLQSPAAAELPQPVPTDTSAPDAEPSIASAPSEFTADWDELSRMIEPVEDVSDIRYTGVKEDHLLNLDEEFVVVQTDEAVPPARKQTPKPACAAQNAVGRESHSDVDYIIGKINDIIDMVSEREGKK